MLAGHKKMTQENFDLLWYSWIHNINYVKRKPGLLAKMNRGAWHPKKRSAAQVADFSTPFLLAVIRSPFITDDIAYDIMEQKYFTKDTFFQRLAHNKNISSHLTDLIISFAFRENHHHLASVISKNTTFEKNIRQLYDAVERRSLKNEPENSIFREEENPILFGLLENPKTPKDVLQVIMSRDDPYDMMPYRLARNTSAPPLFLARLLKNFPNNEDAVNAAVQNTSTPLISLLKFAKADIGALSRKAFFTAVKAKGLSIDDYPNDGYLPKLCADLGIDYEKL